MAQLTALQLGLTKVRRYRATARIASALAWFACIVLWVLLGAFLLDVTLHMGRFERLIVLVLFGVAVVWSLRKWVVPAFLTYEDEVSLALMVERQQDIHTDLVAALQFADPGRAQFGSSDLRGAVIEYTDEVASHLDYLEGFSRKTMVQRLVAFIVTMIVAFIPVVAFGEHTHVFFDRFLLGNTPYPTDTVIESINSPGDRVPYGRPVVFKVRVAGVIPEDGMVDVRAVNSGLATQVKLTPSENDATLFTGELPRALDELSYRIRLGDAYMEPRTIELIPLPIIDLTMRVEVPEYARDRFDAGDVSARQPIALEGSRVTPIVRPHNKPLERVAIKIGEQTFPLKPTGDVWTLDATGTPFDHVDATLRYELDVIDADGLTPERAMTGVIQVRADQPPRIAAATATQAVLPTAAPRIRFRAIDDYGLARVIAHRAVVRQQTDDTGVATTEPIETETTLVEPPNHEAEIANTIAVDFTDLQLVKGDRVIVTLEAVDHRGELAGKSTRSEKMVFQVTDRAGVLAAMRELDTQMDKKLDQIIKAQLGIGDQP